MIGGTMPSVFVTEWPRSGSTWFISYLAECLGYTVAGDCGPDADGYIVRVHSYPRVGTHDSFIDSPGMAYEMAAGKIVVMVRDPRDVIVSAYYMAIRNGQWFSRNMTIDEYVRDIFLNCNPPWYSGYPTGPERDWADFYRSWVDLCPEYVAAIVRHEDLMADRIGETRRVLNALGYEVEDHILHSKIGRYDNRTRPIYDERYATLNETWNRRDKKTVIVRAGESYWRDYLKGDTLRLIRRYWFRNLDILERLGYEWGLAPRVGANSDLQENRSIVASYREQSQVPRLSQPALSHCRRWKRGNRRRYASLARRGSC